MGILHLLVEAMIYHLLQIDTSVILMETLNISMRHFINLIESAHLMEHTRYFDGFVSEPAITDTQRYMRGWCPYFALALHDVYGFQLIGADEHFACRLPDDHFVDIRGVMSLEQFKTGLGHADLIDLSRDEVMAHLDAGDYKCGFYNDRDMKKAIGLVKRLGLKT